MTGAEEDWAALQAGLQRQLTARAAAAIEIEEIDAQDLRLRFTPGNDEMAADGRIMQSVLLGYVDSALMAAALRVPTTAPIEIVNLAVSFFKPVIGGPIISLSRPVVRSRGHIHLEAWLFVHAAIDPIAHATASAITSVSAGA